MALGSSAPEILLAIIETVALGFEAGDLGPGTIVGSAAFNLFIITSICVVSVPHRNDDESECGIRKINQYGVFCITVVFSILAYVWMYIVLSASSPDEIELWEAMVTLAMFPLLVLLAYMQDRNYFNRCKNGSCNEVENDTQQHIVDFKATGSESGEVDIAHLLRKKGNLTEEEIERIAQAESRKKVVLNKLQYRLNANSRINGRKRVIQDKNMGKVAPGEAQKPEIVIGFSSN